MAETDLNKLYEAIGGLTAQVKGLRRDVQEDRRTAADYRAGMREELGKLVIRTTQLEADMTAVKAKTDKLESATDEVVVMRERALGAGTLGRWLLRIGGILLGAASGAAGVYYSMTGRPPP